jgi:hypothetical protein
VALYDEGDRITWVETGTGETHVALVIDTAESFGSDPLYFVALMDGKQWPVYESEVVAVIKGNAA